MSNLFTLSKRLFTYFIVFFLLMIKLSLQENNNSSLVLYLNEIGIKKYEKDILPFIFKPTDLPAPGAFETDVDFIGKLKINITKLSLKFNEFDMNQLSLDFLEPNALNLKVSNISGNLNFTYIFNSGFYNNEDVGNITFSNLGVGLLSNLTTVKNKQNPGKLGPNVQFESIDIQDNPKLKINFNSDGRLEALVKFFFDLISTSISDEIVKKLNTTDFVEINSQISEYASSIELKGDINNITVDYGLNSAPKISQKTLELAFDTNLTSTKDNYTYIGQKYPVPHIFDYSDSPLHGIFNQYLLDGAFTLMERDGKLNGYVPAETVQSDYFSLDVNGVSAFFSSITDYYDKNDKVDLNVTSVAPPSIAFKNKKLNGHFNLTIDFLVRQGKKQGEKVTAVKANFLFIAELDFTIENLELKVKIKSLQVDKMLVLKSTIGDLDAEKIKKSINFKINIILFAKSSFDIDLSIYIPKIFGSILENASIIPHEGYLEFGVIPQQMTSLKNKKTLSLFDTALEKIKIIQKNVEKEVENHVEKEVDEDIKNKNLKFLH